MIYSKFGNKFDYSKTIFSPIYFDDSNLETAGLILSILGMMYERHMSLQGYAMKEHFVAYLTLLISCFPTNNPLMQI